MSNEKLSHDQMLRSMFLFYEFGLGRPGVTLKRRVKHTQGYSGWTAEELDALYLEMVSWPSLQKYLEPENPSDRPPAA